MRQNGDNVKILPLIICAAMLPAAVCTSCGDNDRGDGANHMYDASLIGNPQSLDPQYADDQSSNTVIQNMFSGLMRSDAYGNISCCNAASYSVSDDGTKYTFQLRRDNYWFIDKNRDDIMDKGEYFPVTAGDYEFALKRLLDPRMQSPYAWDYSCIKGGESIIKGELSPDSAGVRAVDDSTLEIELEYPCAEFLELLAASPASPCNEEFFTSTKGRYGLDDNSIMSNGPFYLRQWFYDPYGHHNILYMRRNDMNSSPEDPVIPAYLSFTIERSESDAAELFKDGDIDCFSTLSDSYSSKKYAITGTKTMTLGLIFNPEDKYFKNENMRRALACSIDREALDETLDSDLKAAYGIIPPAVNIAGRSYRELSADVQFDSYDLSAAAEYCEKGKKEAKTASVEGVKIIVCADTFDSRCLHFLSQSWQDSLGMYIGIEDVSREDFFRRLEEGDYSIALYPLEGKMPTGLSVIRQFESDQWLRGSAKDGQYTSDILRCDDIPSLIEGYAAAEKEILSRYSFIPLFYKNNYVVAGKDNEDIFLIPGSDALDFRLAKNYG